MFICSEDQSCTTRIHPCPFCSLQIKAKVSYRFSHLDSSLPKTNVQLGPCTRSPRNSQPLRQSTTSRAPLPRSPVQIPDISDTQFRPFHRPSPWTSLQYHHRPNRPRRAAIVFGTLFGACRPLGVIDIYCWTFLLRLLLEVDYWKHQV